MLLDQQADAKVVNSSSYGVVGGGWWGGGQASAMNQTAAQVAAIAVQTRLVMTLDN